MSVKFSVIIPVHELDPAEMSGLGKCLKAVSEQTIGASEIEVILAGPEEGRTAAQKKAAGKGFAEVKYAAHDNIIGAFCTAFDMMSGELLMFIDPADRWIKTAFRTVYEYYHEAPEWFDVLTCRPFPVKKYPRNISFFYIYRRKTRVTDIYTENGCLITSLSTTVIRTSALRECEIDPSVDYNFDSYLAAMLLVRNPKLGVLDEELVERARIRHDGYCNEYDDELGRMRSIIRYHHKLLSFRNEFNNTYFNKLILYDMRSFIVDDDYKCEFSQENKEFFMEHIADVFSRLDNYSTDKTPELTDAQRWGLLLLENNDDKSAKTLLSYKSPFKDTKPFHVNIRSIFTIHQMYLEGGNIVFEGMSPAFLSGAVVEIYAKTQDGRTHKGIIEPYEKINIMNCFGEVVSYGKRIRIEVPVRKRTTIRFYVQVNGKARVFKPEYVSDVRIRNNWSNSCCYMGNYIVSLQNGSRVSVRENSRSRKIMNEWRIEKEGIRRRDFKALKARRKKLKLERSFYSGTVKKQVAFVSARSDSGLMDNMQSVWDCCHENKIVFTKRMPYSPETMKKVAETVYRSKVVITDDYFFPLRKYAKRDDQYVIQIWHAPGAFKKFGVEGTTQFPGTDAMYHKNYDLVAVSSEYVRSIYAGAFQIDVDRVKALGMPRTDKFFDGKYLEERRAVVYERFPELRDKQVILYAPTFREIGGKNIRTYLPELDYGKINDSLNDGQIMVIRPHPLMPPYEGEWEYDKIKLVQDISTNDFMLVADLMITDYSSVIFEYSLLDKPMVFFCFDYDEYTRDFYLDYENELPGEIFKDTESLTEYLGAGDFSCSSKLHAFRDKYMSACDGHSSERVAAAITEYLNK